MKIFLFLLLLSPLFGYVSNIVGVKITPLSDGVRLVIKFDSQYTGVITYKNSNSFQKVVLNQAALSKHDSRTIDSEFVDKIDFLPFPNRTDIIFYTTKKLHISHKKSLNEKILILKLTANTGNENLSPQGKSALDNISWRYIATLSFLAVGGFLLYIFRNKLKNAFQKQYDVTSSLDMMMGPQPPNIAPQAPGSTVPPVQQAPVFPQPPQPQNIPAENQQNSVPDLGLNTFQQPNPNIASKIKLKRKESLQEEPQKPPHQEQQMNDNSYPHTPFTDIKQQPESEQVEQPEQQSDNYKRKRKSSLAKVVFDEELQNGDQIVILEFLDVRYIIYKTLNGEPILLNRENIKSEPANFDEFDVKLPDGSHSDLDLKELFRDSKEFGI